MTDQLQAKRWRHLLRFYRSDPGKCTLRVWAEATDEVS